MDIVCAWCLSALEVGDAVEALARNSDRGLNHGICDGCLRRLEHEAPRAPVGNGGDSAEE